MKKEVRYQKLVRDGIPAILKAKGIKAEIRKIAPSDLLFFLIEKLQEETKELWDAEPDHKAEELADIFEVLEATLIHLGIPMEKVLEIKEAKKAERGGFAKGVFLVKTIQASNVRAEQK